MLEISQTICNEIAKEPTEHSWANPLLEIKGQEKADEAYHLMSQWIEATAKKMYPKAENVDRIVRTTFLHLLECEAIESYLEKHPMVNVPVVWTADEAAYVGAMDVMYVPQTEVKQAEEMLDMMLEGTLKPDLQTIIL